MEDENGEQEVLYELNIDEIREKAEAMGKTNTQWNVHLPIIEAYKEIEDSGLTPIVLANYAKGGTIVTSMENIEGKLH